nr:HAD hydrolase family protein [Blastochloris viridis]
MDLIAFATDYDGTLAHDGRVDSATVAALERLKASGRWLAMVTGRNLGDLLEVFDRANLFDVIVAENGALLYFPATGEERPIAPPPPPQLVEALRARGVAPLVVGRGIIATREPHETTVLACIRNLGLDWQIVFNKGAVMVLAPGINKASGLSAALAAFDLAPINTIAIGDAENDLAFLSVSGCGVAVANALDAVKATADWVTAADHGAGVVEAIDALIADDARFASLAAERHRIPLGADGSAALRFAHGGVLIAGASGHGKSTLVTAILEKLAAQGFQTCVLDPEGDYETLQDAVVLGDASRAPVADEVLDLLRKATTNVLVVDMLGIAIADRPRFFADLLAPIGELRRRTARPHWLVADEAHHMLPASSDTADGVLVAAAASTIYVTVHPEAVRPTVLAGVGTVIGVGPTAGEVIASFCRTLDLPPPPVPPPAGRPNEVLFWDRADDQPPRWIAADLPRQERQRHTRKYAEGRLGADRSFYFRGPSGLLNLRAHNLSIFMQIADGLDDMTWLWHLRRGDYARWFRDVIKDDDLAAEADRLTADVGPADSRRQLRAMIERRYSAPAEPD